MVRFRTTLFQQGNNVGIEVPEEVVLGFGAGKRVPVTVGLNDYTYASTIASMGGRFLIPVSKAVREAAGVAGVRAKFDALAPSRSKEHVRQVNDAKTDETRARRVKNVVDSLSS